MLLKETRCYKYLGIIINRSLSDTDHRKSNIGDKVKKLDAYLRYTLAGHMNINRVSFGNTLWHKAVLPCLSHGASVWFNDSSTTQRLLQSYQYRLAKAVSRLDCMPSRSALLSELGWLPITDHLNILRINYF